MGILLVLLGSERGTALAAKQVRELAAGAVDWHSLEGSLLGPLSVQHLAVRLPGTALDIASLSLDWAPAALLAGRVDILSVQATGVDLALAQGEESQPDTALDIAALQPPLDIHLRQLEIAGLTLRSGDSPAQQVDSIALSARTEGADVELAQLALRAPQGGLQAAGHLRLDNTLAMDLRASWQWALADGQQLGGELLASGDARILHISHRGSGDLPLQVDGELREILSDLAWSVRAAWPQLPLPTGDGELQLAAGSLDSSGSLAAYTLDSEGGIIGLAAEPLRWSLQVPEGDLQGLELGSLRVAGEPGAIAISGRVAWDGPVAAQLEYRLQGRDLQNFAPDLPAQLDGGGRLRLRYSAGEAQLDELHFALDQTTLQLSAHAVAKLADGAPPDFDASLSWENASWPLLSVEPGAAAAEPVPLFSSPEGTLHIAGTSEDYRLQVTTRHEGRELPPVEWRGEARGDSSGLEVDQLLGQLLDGQLGLRGNVTWAPLVSWQLEASGSDLDPGSWIEALPGKLALALSSSGHIDHAGSLQAQLDLQQLSGSLSGQAFRLSARASASGETLDLAGLQLDSGDNHLSARGSLSAQALDLQWQLQAPRPGTLLPGVEGSLAGSGRISGSGSAPRLQARLSGDNLAFEGQSLALLRADLDAGLAAQAPLAIDLQLADYRSDAATLVQSARLEGSGSTASHRLRLSVEGAEDSLSAELAGALDGATREWRGSLEQLLASTAAFGDWALAAPAALSLGPTAQTLGELCLQASTPPDRFCASAHYAAGSGGELALALDTLTLSRFAEPVEGSLQGQLAAALAADGALQAEGQFSLSAGGISIDSGSGTQQLRYRGGELALLVGGEGLLATLSLDGQQQQLLAAQLALPEFRRLPPAGQQPLRGYLRSDMDDISGLAALVPELANTRGRLHADLAFSGSLEQPLLQGELSLRDGAADVLPAGLKLRDLELALQGDPERPGYLYLSGAATSGPGSLTLDGQLKLRDQSFDLAIRGEQVEVWNTRDGRALLSPDLSLRWADELATVRGRLEIPRADITPKLAISPGSASEEVVEEAPEVQVIASSADVVILGADGQPLQEPVEQLPFRLDSRIELLLGERVEVNALGFNGKITGGVTFINRPQKRQLIPTADGSLSIEDGTFRAFGQDLDIQTGAILFARVPATQPEITLRAVRWIDNDPMVSAAGVLVSGPAASPQLELFSRPQLDPAEIQSYLLTGHSADSEDSVLGIGTYLHPKLYVGYGYNLIAETSEFDALYTITPRYGIEATAGEADNRVNLTFTHER